MRIWKSDTKKTHVIIVEVTEEDLDALIGEQDEIPDVATSIKQLVKEVGHAAGR